MAKKKPTPDAKKPPPTESDSAIDGEDDLSNLVAVLDYLVAQFITKSEENSDGPSLSISDLVRTVQLRRELIPEALVREIEVRWVESSGTDL